MRHRHRALHRRRWGALLVVLAAVTACDSPTAPESLAVTVQTVALATEAERDAWPFTPTVHGGPSVRVRGTALITCARPIGAAMRRGNLVELHIAGDPATTMCPANVAGWQPVEATIVGLAPASYRVRVTAVGHVGHAEWVVNVLRP
jgi:hypothetical protein